MKNFLLILIILALNFNFAQTIDEFYCGMPENTITRPERGGLFKPSEGNLHALVIFVQFPDDTLSGNGSWPVTEPKSAPTWINDYVSGLNNYFSEMSNGVFTLSGQTYFYEPQDSQKSYTRIAEVNQEALVALDAQIDYSDYDNFTGTLQGSDNIVDMIFFVYRNFENRLWRGFSTTNWTGLADFQLSEDLFLDNIEIKQGLEGGSGV